jgi:uncharacterized cupin superfamily protein
MIMATARKGVRLFTPNDVQTWYQPEGRRIFLGDVLDATTSDTMSVGFARYAPGQANEWVVTYDEALIVTKGTYTVTAEDGTKTTAKVGEFIFLTRARSSSTPPRRRRRSSTSRIPIGWTHSGSRSMPTSSTSTTRSKAGRRIFGRGRQATYPGDMGPRRTRRCT